MGGLRGCVPAGSSISQSEREFRARNITSDRANRKRKYGERFQSQEDARESGDVTVASSRDKWEKRCRGGFEEMCTCREGSQVMRFSQVRVCKAFRSMKYRRTVPRGSLSKEMWQKGL